jgi:hypothetical protein
MNLQFNAFKDVFSRKLMEARNKGELLDIVRFGEEYLPNIPDDRQGFVFSYANYEHAVLDCRKLKDLLPNVRVEMMVGVRDLPYPFTCVVETSVADMRGLDEQLALEHRKLGLTDDEMGMRTIAQLIGEKQSLLRKETWQKDPELFGFSEWEE